MTEELDDTEFIDIKIYEMQSLLDNATTNINEINIQASPIQTSILSLVNNIKTNVCSIIHKNWKKIFPEPEKNGFYTTPVYENSSIIDAVSGRYTTYRIGKNNAQHLFFAVSVPKRDFEKNIRAYFFHSPSEYEKHFNRVVPEDYKHNWKIKKEAAIIKNKLHNYSA